MFDRSLLDDCLFEFVVVSDTHYMVDPDRKRVEFQSRLKQSARAEVALRLVSSLNAAFIVHLGDLVQEYPDTQAFPTAMQQAREQLARCNMAPRQVAGNHDVGDKPDPTMPTRPVTPESLAMYHDWFGRSWYSFDRDDCHFVVLNSQIMNTSLPEATEQQSWAEADVQEHSGKRTFVFLHLPPYVCDADEQALGHYDNIAKPARSWLLELVRKHGVEMLFAGHVHCALFDRIESTRYLVCNSTSFTRPGFCHLFTSGPPPDQGRDDFDKLGFYLLRVFDDRTDVHFLRTHGEINIDRWEKPNGNAIVTRTSKSLPNSPLGITLRHPLSHLVEIPLAWPSSIRQRVRNDYPLLECLELGVSSVRLPADDLFDEFQSSRLAILRDEGVNMIATKIWSDDFDLKEMFERLSPHVDGLEFQLPGTTELSEEKADRLRRCDRRDVSISLSTIIPQEIHTGKQHPRTRHGFRLEELAPLNQQLEAATISIDRVLCRIDVETGPWETIQQFLKHDSFKRIGQVDFAYELENKDDRDVVNLACEALFAMTLVPKSCLFLEPLIELDRTMDVCPGLLDTLCNPRPAFHALRVMNSVMASIAKNVPSDDPFVPTDVSSGEYQTREVRTASAIMRLILPYSESLIIDRMTVADMRESMSGGTLRLFRLVEGDVIDCDAVTPDSECRDIECRNIECQGPALLVTMKERNTL